MEGRGVSRLLEATRGQLCLRKGNRLEWGIGNLHGDDIQRNNTGVKQVVWRFRRLGEGLWNAGSLRPLAGRLVEAADVPARNLAVRRIRAADTSMAASGQEGNGKFQRRLRNAYGRDVRARVCSRMHEQM